MKMKHIFLIGFLCSMALAFNACDDSEELENKIDFSSPYVLTDDPSDPVNHHRYEIYKKYGVPVFFNDTVSKTLIGKNHDGTPLYRYETLDFKWSFSGYDRDTKFEVHYIENPEVQEKALKMVDEFLSHASKPMRPFSIFLPSDLIIIKSNGTEKPKYWSGFRTLIIPEAQTIASDKIAEFASNTLITMVKDKVTSNENLVNRFGEVSDKEKWYGKSWADLGCVWGVEHKGTYWKPSQIYDPLYINRHITDPANSGVSTMEEFEAERALVFQQIGRFGFISGNVRDYSDHLQSPRNITTDLNDYLTQMIDLGSKEFLNRFGGAPLVLKKYNIIADYINNELEVEF